MDILLSWQLVVASILFLTSVASSELEICDPPTDSTLFYKILKDKSPTKLSSVQYKSVSVNIYDSHITNSNNKRIYFHSPIALLENANVASIHNITHPSLTVGFTISNEEVRKKVIEQLKQQLSPQIELSQVRVLPYESVRLTSKVQFADFSLTNEWIPYVDRPSARFTLICPTREDCERVKNQMRIKHEQFDHLKLDFKFQFNEETYFNEGVGVSQDLSQNLLIHVKELQKSLEETKLNFAKELNAIREENSENLRKSEAASQVAMYILKQELHDTQKDFAATTKTLLRILADQIEIIEDKLKDTQKDFAATTKMALMLADKIEIIEEKLIVRTSEINDIGKMPTNCADLERMGHVLSGFFLVKGLKKIEAVYCDFYPNQNDLQKWIGYADVKSAPVHFYVQKNSTFSTLKTPIPFDLAVVNEGNAMNSTSGIFTAPRPGIYFFSFTGVATFPASSSKVNLYIFLYLNGGYVGTGYVEEANTVTGQSSPLRL